MSKDLGAEVRKRERRGTWYAIVGLVVLLGGLYVAGHFLLGNRLPTGTRIAGVGVGGLTPDEAKERLEADLAPHTKQTLTFYFEDREYKIKPGDIGLDLHIEQSVESAGGGRTWDPVRMLENLVGADRLDPVVTLDDAALEKRVTKIADGIDVAPIEPRITFDGSQMQTRRPAAGRRVQRQEFEDLVRDQFVQDHEAQPVPVDIDRPGVRASEFDKAVNNRVQTAVGSPVRIAIKGKTFTLSPSEVKSMLSYVSRGGSLSPQINMDRFRSLINQKAKGLRRSPTNATVVLRSGKPKVVSDKPGLAVDFAGAKAAVVDALRRKKDKRVVKLTMQKSRAGFRTDNAKKLGIKRRIGTYKTTYGKGGGVNPGRTARRLDGIVLRPGQTLSFNAKVGSPGRSGANRDGASQVATTLLNAGLRSGLKVVERHRYPTYQPRLPAGRDAIVGPAKRDLRLKNTSKYGVLVNARADPQGRRGTVHVELWSSKQWKVDLSVGKRHNKRKPPVRKLRRKRCSPQAGQQGFDIDVQRRLISNGETVAKSTLSTSYAPLPRIRCIRRN